MSTNSYKVSIVIPCYNSSQTLEEAVNSCFSQGLDHFEIIMIDDGSTDETPRLMETLAKKHKEIKVFFNKENKGGGATRNIGINAADGEFICCLDSDNYFTPNSLHQMVSHLIKKSADGVAFHERRFFNGNNPNRYTSLFNTVLDRSINISDLFTDPNILLDNFLFTKKSFLKTQGYPEHHGFDTQGFEIRYLSAGNIVYICPGSIFYHRQVGKNQSYFEREYNAGNFSLNYYLCIEDILDLFSNTALKTITIFDIFKKTTLNDNLFVALKILHKKNLLFRKKSEEIDESMQIFIQAIETYKNQNYDKSLDYLRVCLKNGLSGKTIYYNMLRVAKGLSGTEKCLIEKEVSLLIEGMLTKPEILYKKYYRNPFLNRIISAVFNLRQKFS